MQSREIKWSELLSLDTLETWPADPPQLLPVRPAASHCVVLWEERASAPSSIVVAPAEVESFYAWVFTYAPHLVPLSATVHVCGADWDGSDVHRDVWHSKEAVLGALGLVAGEASALCDGYPEASLGLSPFLATCSWSLFRMARNAPNRPATQELCKLWIEARTLVNGGAFPYGIRHVEETWRIVRSAEGDRAEEPRDSSEREAARILQSLPGEEDKAFAQVAPQDALRGLGEGPLERRVEAFLSLAERVEAQPSDHVGSMLLGYGLSKISQGSFRHTALLDSKHVRDVRPLLWYGWFEFRRSADDSIPPKNTNVGRRLMALSKDDGGCRTIDVAIEELRVLARDPSWMQQVPLDLRHPLRVGLVDGAEAVVQPRVAPSERERRRTGDSRSRGARERR